MAMQSVGIQGLIQAQNNFESALGVVNTALKDMSMQQQTLQDNWSGETSSAFGAALGQWVTDCTTVQTQLSNIIETLSQTTSVYANTNESSSQVAKAFMNGMSGGPGLGMQGLTF
jgi:WXG100 family type VII secretion target